MSDDTSPTDRERSLSDELGRSIEAAQASDRARVAFLGHLGNEIATPLHGALGNLELIDRSALSALDQERLDVVTGALRQLNGVVSGLLQLAATDGVTSEPRMSSRRPSEFLEELTDGWLRRLAAQGHLLFSSVVSDDEVRLADWRRLARVADALLDNVLRHAVAGPCRLEFGVDDEGLWLAVQDSGPGIGEEVVAQATAPLFRADGAAGAAGPAVGLAVANRLAVAGGGRLAVDGVGGGTRVTVWLPRERRTLRHVP